MLVVVFGFILCTPLKDYPKRVIRVGVVFSADIPYYRALHRRFLKVIKEKLPGTEIEFLVQKPNPDPLAWTNAVRKLLVYDSEIIVVYGSGALKAALQEVSDTPVVFAGTFNTSELTQRGKRNLGGIFYKININSIMRYMKKLKKPGHVDILFSEIEPSSQEEAKALMKQCMEFRFDCSLHGVSNYDELTYYAAGVDADSVFVAESGLIAKYLSEFHKGFLKKRIPLVTTMPGLEDMSVFSLEPDIKHEADGLAELLAKTVKNKGKTGGVMTIRKTRLVFNMGLAKKLQTNIPIELISYADEVIK